MSTDPVKVQAEIIAAAANSIEAGAWVSDVEARLAMIADAMQKIRKELDRRRGGER